MLLIWHADLAHHGASIATPGRSRRSLVTHVTTDSNAPFYRRTSRYRAAEEDAGTFVPAYYDVPAG